MNNNSSLLLSSHKSDLLLKCDKVDLLLDSDSSGRFVTGKSHNPLANVFKKVEGLCILTQ